MSMTTRQRHVLSYPEAWVLAAHRSTGGGYETGEGVLEEGHSWVIHPQGVQRVDQGRERVTVQCIVVVGILGEGISVCE